MSELKAKAMFQVNGGEQQEVPQEIINKAIKDVTRDIKWNLFWAIWCYSCLCWYEWVAASRWYIVLQACWGTVFFLLALNGWRKITERIYRKIARGLMIQELNRLSNAAEQAESTERREH